MTVVKAHRLGVVREAPNGAFITKDVGFSWEKAEYPCCEAWPDTISDWVDCLSKTYICPPSILNGQS